MQRATCFTGLAATLVMACGGAGGINAPSLASGAEISATTQKTISSENQKAGETLTASVSADLKNDAGRVVIPAGSTLNLVVETLRRATDKSGSDGQVVFTVNSVTIGKETYSIDASVSPVRHTLKGRGVGAGEVGTTAAGAVAGGIIGRVVGGNKTGTVVGAVAGGAAGAVVADHNADRDVVVASGTRIVVTLNGKFSAK